MKCIMKLRLYTSFTVITIFMLRFVKVWHVESMRNCQNMFFWYQYAAKHMYMISWINYFSRVHYQWIVRIWIILKFNFYKNLPRIFIQGGILTIKKFSIWFRRRNLSTTTFFIGFFATVFDVATITIKMKNFIGIVMINY